MIKVKNNRVYCFDPKKRKYQLIGTKLGDTLVKRVNKNHFMRMVNGYGIQYDAFNDFLKKGIKKIVISEKESGNKWESETEEWFINGKVADYGHGKQVFLSLKYMNLKKKLTNDI